jgi:hypothetical protein
LVLVGDVGEDDMEAANGQQLGLALGEPSCSGGGRYRNVR